MPYYFSPKISIIVPVYNTESYLKQCIDSIRNQSMYEIEIILVDDGSQDGCGEICDRYAESDSRIEVIHQTNQGLSAARNAGLDIARGEYIMFVDSDDWVEPDFCKIPYKLAERNQMDMVLFGYRTIDEERDHPYHYTNVPSRGSDEWPDTGPIKRENAVHFIFHFGNNLFAWSKMYSRRLLEQIRFIPGRCYEDHPFTAEVILNAGRILYTDEELYNYRRREGSITKTNSRKNMVDYYEMMLLASKSLESHGFTSEAKDERSRASWGYLLAFGNRAEHSRECRDYLLSQKQYPFFFRIRSKVMYRTLHISPRLFDIMCTLFGRKAE